MSMAQSLLPEYDHEMGLTRKMLERLPEGELDFQPHPRSMTLRRLASHLAELPHWAVTTLETEDFDVAPPDGPAWQPTVVESRGEALEAFDRHVARARALLAEASDEALGQPWSLKRGGEAMFTQPRGAVLRGMILNHMIHHRAQLGVYYRLVDVPVPALYGPSADESAG